MKILFIAPLTRKIDAKSNSGRTRIIFDLIRGILKKGHKATMIGTKDSYIPNVEIIPAINKGFYEISGSFENSFYAHTAFLVAQSKIMEKVSSNFDVIHNHSYPEFINLLTEKNIKTPIVTTLHSAIHPELDNVLSLFNRVKFICPSKKNAKIAQKTKIYKVISHGVDTDLYKFSSKKENYFLWVGRLSKAKDKMGNFMDPKGVKWAIKLAQKTNSELRLVANVEDVDFFRKEVKPHLSNKIKWVGKISQNPPLSKKEISKLMQKAKALLMTAKFQEAFGLVAAEAQSCGTPVIGFKQGPVSEIIINNKTGFLSDINHGISGLMRAVNKILKIKPYDCRKNVEDNFSIRKMIDKYEETYFELTQKSVKNDRKI